MVEEVVTSGQSVAVPVKGVQGSRFALPDLGISRCVGLGFGRLKVAIGGLGIALCGSTCG